MNVSMRLYVNTLVIRRPVRLFLQDGRLFGLHPAVRVQLSQMIGKRRVFHKGPLAEA